MKNKYNLLVESSDQIEVLTERTDQGTQTYIEGIFAQSEQINGNGRMYERPVMEKAIDKYVTDYVSKRRALGELKHPDYPTVDPAEACIRITELRWQGNDVYGKAIVLNTPKGQIVKGLLDGGFNMGVSTRALGSLKEKNGVKYVQDDLMFTAVDCVDNPSAPDAYVNALTECRKWMINESGRWVPTLEQQEQDPRANDISQEIFFEKLQQFIKGLR
jgi:hypothetical protein